MIRPLEAGNSIQQLILQNKEPETLRGNIRKVNRVTRHLAVLVNGYGLMRRIPVNRGINLGTPDRPVVFPGDTAVLTRGQNGWVCVNIEQKDRCGSKTSEFVGDVVIENEVEPVSANSTVVQQIGALDLPGDLFLPPFQLLGQLTLPTQRFSSLLICGIPACTNCAPDGYTAGYVLKLSVDAAHPGGCWVWGPRQTVQGGVLWMVDNEYIYKIDTFISSQVTSSAPYGKNIEMGLPQDAIHLLAPEVSPLESGLYRSTDGTTYSRVLLTHEIQSLNLETGHVLNFDRSNRTYGYGVSMLSIYDDQEVRQELQEYIDEVTNQWYPPSAGFYGTSTPASEVDWFFQGMTVYALITVDGGASWNEYAIDNLGELVPSRIGGSSELISESNWIDHTCNLTTLGNPTGIPEAVLDDGGDFENPADYLGYQVCSVTYDPDDPDSNGMPVVTFPKVVGFLGAVAKHNGTGFYIFIETVHMGEQLDNGLYTSPWVPWVQSTNSSGTAETIWTQWVWSVNNVGSASRIEIALGSEYTNSFSYDGTNTDGTVHAFIKGVSKPSTDHIFTLFKKYDGSDNYYGCDKIDFSAATATDLSAPFDTVMYLEQPDLACTAAGTLFVYTTDLITAKIWRYDGSWTSTDVSAHSTSAARFAYSQVDAKLYLLFGDNLLGETDDDGTSWTFTAVTGVYAGSDVDTY